MKTNPADYGLSVRPIPPPHELMAQSAELDLKMKRYETWWFRW